MSDNRTTELLPCPFCGGEAHVHVHYSFLGHERKGEYPSYEPIGYAVGCGTLDCRGKRENTGFMYETESEAIAAWNTRAELTCRDASVDSSTQFYCSECECTVDVPLLWGAVSYCPGCGAKVIGEPND